MQNTVGTSLYERQSRSYVNLVLNILLAVLAVLLIAAVLFNIYFVNIYVDGRSMLPTLTGADEFGNGGDYVFVNIRAEPTYGDIVVVRTGSGSSSDGKTKFIIKRAIAFGGDTVKLERGVLYIKYRGSDVFTAVEENYVSEYYNDPVKSVNNYPEHTVAENCVFLLGDNRNESSDSRYHGDYPISDVYGVVPAWALEHKGAITALYSFFHVNKSAVAEIIN